MLQFFACLSAAQFFANCLLSPRTFSSICRQAGSQQMRIENGTHVILSSFMMIVSTERGRERERKNKLKGKPNSLLASFSSSLIINCLSNHWYHTTNNSIEVAARTSEPRPPYTTFFSPTKVLNRGPDHSHLFDRNAKGRNRYG